MNVTDINEWPTYPVIYEINTWVWLNELGEQAGKPVTLGTVPQAELDRIAGLGFDAVWLMGVWQRSLEGRRVARQHPDLQEGYHRALPDFSPEDVVGSPYAIRRYGVDPALGGDEGLAVLRGRLRELGLRLILDFAPNHLAVDHPWVEDHPELLVQGDPVDSHLEPQIYFTICGDSDERTFAHGRDPYFPAWTDTVQLDYRRPETRRAMTDTLLDLAGRCDGVRCDMAMLVTHDVFLRTWGGAFDPPGAEFWPAAIEEVKNRHPDFLMMAEVYWDMEYALQQQGFDYTYDKRLYDRLLGNNVEPVRQHLWAGLDYQRHLLRFVENHDEERALAAFGPQRSRAAAALALTLPGARLLHEGQLAGRSVKLPVQLGRRARESPDPKMEAFYGRLLRALAWPVFHEGRWELLDLRPEWSGNPSHRNFVAHRWLLEEAEGKKEKERRLVVVNLASTPSQGFVMLDFTDLGGRSWLLHDLLANDVEYVRDGDDLMDHGLYLSVPGQGYHLFDLRPVEGE